MSENVQENVSNLSKRAEALLRDQGLMRAFELRAQGVTPATLSRLVDRGRLLRVGRGLYQLSDAEVDPNHSLAQAAKQVPKGVVCLASALSYYGLTDQLPARTWMAVGKDDWAPRIAGLRLIRTAPVLLRSDIVVQKIDGVPVKMFTRARCVVDAFRHEGKVGRNLAIESLRSALRDRTTSPAEIADTAKRLGAWTKVRPYLEALTADA